MSESFSPDLMLAIYRIAEDECSDTSVTYEISKSRVRIVEWIKSLASDEQESVKYLIAKDVLYLNLDKEEVDPWVCLNDVFAGAADGEGVNLEEIKSIHKIHLKYGWDGVVAWFSNKLGGEPWTSRQRTPEYKQALKELQQEDK